MKTYVCEHKTANDDIGPGSFYWRKLTLDDQISNYLVGARSLGHEPDGVLYDVLRKPSLEPLRATPIESRKYTKPTKTEPSRLYSNHRERDETPVEYHDRIMSDIAERPDYYYQRGVVVRLESEEHDAAFDTWQTASAIRESSRTGRWPRNVDACSQFRRMCDYWPVCSGETTIDDPALFSRHGPHRELSDSVRTSLPILTTSSAKCFRACPRRYYYAYELGVRPRIEAGALGFGKRIHVALEDWMQSRDLDKAIAAMGYSVYDHEAAKAEAMIRGYHARWCNEPIEAVAVEVEFVCDLINPETGAKSRTFRRAGRIDAVVRRQDV